jgi:hypothetical protein
MMPRTGEAKDAKRVQIGESRKGPFGEKEDWYHFVVGDDGKQCVEHEWSYTDPYGKNPGSDGTKKISVDEFLAGDYGDGMKAVVRDEIKKNR